jgi:hypothetical protein
MFNVALDLGPAWFYIQTLLTLPEFIKNVRIIAYHSFDKG